MEVADTHCNHAILMMRGRTGKTTAGKATVSLSQQVRKTTRSCRKASSPLVSSPAKGKPKGKGRHPHVESMPPPETDEEAESSQEGELEEPEEPGDEPCNNGMPFFFPFHFSILYSPGTSESEGCPDEDLCMWEHTYIHM